MNFTYNKPKDSKQHTKTKGKDSVDSKQYIKTKEKDGDSHLLVKPTKPKRKNSDFKQRIKTKRNLLASKSQLIKPQAQDTQLIKPQAQDTQLIRTKRNLLASKSQLIKPRAQDTQLIRTKRNLLASKSQLIGKVATIINPIESILIITNSLPLDKCIIKTQKLKTKYLNKTQIIGTMLITGGSEIKQNSKLKIISYIDKKLRNIYINKKFGNGSFNGIFKFSIQKDKKIEKELVIRITNSSANEDIVPLELEGIKKQFKLCNICPNIATIVDYGKIFDKLNEYSIVKKYGISLKILLENNPKFLNIGVIIKFMKDFLIAISCIHQNNYGHLDLKPSNILLNDYFKIKKPKQTIKKINFSIIDFGASKEFNNDNSIVIEGQMGSPAFSPPEIKDLKFGKKSDIWSYGVICYLLCLRKFFFKAHGPKIFMNDDKETIIANINKSYKNLLKGLVPNKMDKHEYLKPLSVDTIGVLIDFFKKIFVLDNNKRYNASKLLKHSLFTYIN